MGTFAGIILSDLIYIVCILKVTAFAFLLRITQEVRGMLKDFISSYTAQKINFFIKDFFRKCDRKLRIWSHLLKKSLIENSIFCAVLYFIRGIFN